MTTINLVANDQLLSVALNPVIAAGDVNTVLLHVEFDDVWNEYVKSATFYHTSDEEAVYEVILDDSNECTVPQEVLAESGVLYIGMRGVNADTAAVKTSTLVKYKIKDGAPAGTGTLVDPTPSVYQQLLTLAQQTKETAQSVRDDADNGVFDGVGIKSVVQTTTSTADSGTNVITVTKTDGSTSTFNVRNGSKGSKGDKGDTPQKGTDYFTEADKQEIAEAVYAIVADGNGVEY